MSTTKTKAIKEARRLVSKVKRERANRYFFKVGDGRKETVLAEYYSSLKEANQHRRKRLITIALRNMGHRANLANFAADTGIIEGANWVGEFERLHTYLIKKEERQKEKVSAPLNEERPAESDPPTRPKRPALTTDVSLPPLTKEREEVATAIMDELATLYADHENVTLDDVSRWGSIVVKSEYMNIKINSPVAIYGVEGESIIIIRDMNRLDHAVPKPCESVIHLMKPRLGS